MLEILMILLLQPTVFILHQNDRNPLCENIIESEKRLHNGPLETLATRIYLTLSHNIGEDVILEQILNSCMKDFLAEKHVNPCL